MRNKGKRLEELFDNYVVFDLETTGTNCAKDKIIEIGAIKIREGKVIEEFQTLVNPGKAIPYGATKVNNITDEMVINKPKIEEVIDEFLAFIKDEILVGHNIASFDTNILYDEVLKYKEIELCNDYVDTLYMAKRILKKDSDIENHQLSTLCDFYNIDNLGAHRALKDCYMTNECYQAIGRDYNQYCKDGKEAQNQEILIEATQDEEWKIEIQNMLDELVEVLELPTKALYLAQNVGRVSKKITSYSVSVYEPEFPKLPERKLEQTRNSIVLNIREKDEELELMIDETQFNGVKYDGELKIKKSKSDIKNNKVRIYFNKFDKELIEYIKLNTEYRIKHYSSKASTFGCCSKFKECSDAKKCVHENRLYSMACSYRKNLDEGRIFYGKNRNIDTEDKNKVSSVGVQRIKVDEEEKERRKLLGLPTTKELRYMNKIDKERWVEVLVKDYEIVDTYMPSGTHSLVVTLSTDEKIRILAPYFAHMQKPSFIDDMKESME